MLSSLVWIVLLVLVAVALAALKGKAGGIGAGGTGGFPYRPAKALFTPAERAFLGVLDQAVGPEHRVFGKVRLADVASVDGSLRGGARQVAFNRISAKHLDFLVCRRADLAPVCAIELNDRSHAGRDAQMRDVVKAGVCQAIGLPLLSVSARRAYSVQALREQFQTTSTSFATSAEMITSTPFRRTT